MPVKSYAKRFKDRCGLASLSALARTLDACGMRTLMAEEGAGRS